MFVVWEDQGSVYGAIRLAGVNTWSPPELIASGVSLAGFELDKAGNATILVGTFAAIQVIDRPAGGSWGPPQTIASHTYSGATGLAMADMAVPSPFGRPTTKRLNSTQTLSYTLHVGLHGVAHGAPRPICRCR